jgi:hypothetical protein
MTTSRDLLKQALEFAESVHGGCTDSNDGTVEAITIWCPELIEDIRAHLAKPEPAPVAELCDGIYYCPRCGVVNSVEHGTADIWCEHSAYWINGPFFREGDV